MLRGILYIARKKNKQIDNKKRNLEHLCRTVDMLPLTIGILENAAWLWSEAMLANKIRPKGVDVDMLILAHLEVLKRDYPGRKIIIATKNVKDFNLLNPGDGDEWQNINF